MKAILGIAALLVMAVTGRGEAQPFCPGDSNIDDATTVDEIVAAVNAALNGCPLPVGCPLTFTEPGEFEDCIFVGRWHPLCGSSDLEAIFFIDDEDLIVSLFDPDIDFYAEVIDPGIAFLFAWQIPSTPGEEPQPLDGEVLLSDPPRVALTVFPDEIPFTIGDCNFERYEGRFAEVLGFLLAGEAATDARVAPRVAASRERLRKLRGDARLLQLKQESALRRQRSSHDGASTTRRATSRPQPMSPRPSFERFR